MPYTVRKQKCKQSSGKSGTYVLSYTDKKGKGQIAAIEAEGADILRSYLQEILNENLEQVALKVPEQPSQKEAFKELLRLVASAIRANELRKDQIQPGQRSQIQIDLDELIDTDLEKAKEVGELGLRMLGVKKIT